MVVETLLSHKQRERLAYIISIVATDGLVLKHQAISVHSAELIFILLDQFDIRIYI